MCAWPIRRRRRRCAAGSGGRRPTAPMRAGCACCCRRRCCPSRRCRRGEIQTLRDRTRLRKAPAEDRTRWAQRLHALLTHEGWPCQRARLLTVEGRRWVASLSLSPAARSQVDRLLRLIEAVESELRALDTELRRFAQADRRCIALQTIYGVGPILALSPARRARRSSAADRRRAVARMPRHQRGGSARRVPELQPTATTTSASDAGRPRVIGGP